MAREDGVPRRKRSCAPLLDSLAGRRLNVGIAVLDTGYDLPWIYDVCEKRGVHPVIPLRETALAKAGKHLPRECEHGT